MVIIARIDQKLIPAGKVEFAPPVSDEEALVGRKHDVLNVDLVAHLRIELLGRHREQLGNECWKTDAAAASSPDRSRAIISSKLSSEFILRAAPSTVATSETSKLAKGPLSSTIAGVVSNSSRA